MKRAAFTLPVFITVLYWRSIYGAFVLDDRTFFIENDVLPHIKPWNVKAIFSGATNYWGDLLPVRDVLYVLEYNLFGLNTIGYHLVSIALYILVCSSAYLFLRRFYSDEDSINATSGRARPALVALIVALIFAAYPVHVEAVAYITGQKDLLFSLFAFVAMLVFYVFFNSSKRGKKFAIIGIALYYLALLSKPTAVMLSIVIPLIYLLSDRAKRPKPLNALVLWVVAQIPALLWIITYIHLGRPLYKSIPAILHVPLGERLIAALRILGAHTVLAFKPFPLSFGYPFRLSASVDLNFVAGLVVLAAAILLLLRFRNDRVVVFAICLYMFSLFPVLQLQGPLGNESIYDRYLFIPVLSVAMLFERGLRSLALTHNRPTAYLTAVFVVVIVFSAITFSYIPAFRNDIAVTRNTYQKFPEGPGSGFNYVYSLIESGRLDEAYQITLKEKTLSSPPWVRDYFIGWILLERGLTEQAIPELNAAAYIAMSGGYFPFPNLPLARAYIRAGRDSEAIWLLQEALKSPIYQPLEEYRAREILKQIGSGKDHT